MKPVGGRQKKTKTKIQKKQKNKKLFKVPKETSSSCSYQFQGLKNNSFYVTCFHDLVCFLNWKKKVASYLQSAQTSQLQTRTQNCSPNSA
jgi:regulatory protein YycI of two-component signal transduction system YycFG